MHVLYVIWQVAVGSLPPPMSAATLPAPTHPRPLSADSMYAKISSHAVTASEAVKVFATVLLGTFVIGPLVVVLDDLLLLQPSMPNAAIATDAQPIPISLLMR